MTAEIALLNKSAVALAADSAATVSSGSQQEKVFNSEDKLFELSNAQPIGIMIYNSTTFLGTPIHILIKRYRSQARVFNNIEEAAIDFRSYLRDFAKSLSPKVREKYFDILANYPQELVQTRVNKAFQEIIQNKMKNIKNNSDTVFKNAFEEAFSTSVKFYKEVFQKAGAAKVTGPRPIDVGRIRTAKQPKNIDPKMVAATADLVEAFLKSATPSSGSTGFVIAGFGKNELFPSLRSFEIDGMLGDELRFMNCADQDITLEGSSAKVLPFAQQDMVDRFVSGIDEKSQQSIEKFSKERLSVLLNELIDVLGIDDKDDVRQLKILLTKLMSSTSADSMRMVLGPSRIGRGKKWKAW